LQVKKIQKELKKKEPKREAISDFGKFSKGQKRGRSTKEPGKRTKSHWRKGKLHRIGLKPTHRSSPWGQKKGVMGIQSGSYPGHLKKADSRMSNKKKTS